MLVDVFGARKKREAFEDTWGHLKPEANLKYVGKIVFCQSETGDLVPISSYFADPAGKELPGSPWLQQDLEDFVSEHAKERGQIYIFQGSYWRYENGRGNFSGKIYKAYATIDTTPKEG